MPFVAAIGVAMGATAGVAAVAAGVSAIGMGISVVGKITGNKAMMKIGGVMGLVGGVTSLATSAWGAMSATGAASAAEGGIGLGGAGGAMGQAGDYGMGALASEGASAGIGASATEALTGGLEALSTGADVAGESFAQPSFSDARFEAGRGGGLINASPADFTQGTFDKQVNLGNSSIPTAEQSIWNNSPVNPNASTAPPADKSSGGWKKWWDEQPERVKAAMIMTGGSAMASVFNGWSAEEKLAFEREKHNLTVSNANSQPTVRFASQAVQPRTGGLLNATRTV